MSELRSMRPDYLPRLTITNKQSLFKPNAGALTTRRALQVRNRVFLLFAAGLECPHGLVEFITRGLFRIDLVVISGS
jgi:hypothetical protein